MKQFFLKNGVRSLHIPVVPNKEGSTKTSDQTVNVVMSVLMEKKNHPVIVHCNQGKVGFHFRSSVLSVPYLTLLTSTVRVP
jgi:protein tyrosine phosphatase (PTP) superfamily phosphohydrolase (DUF442 family)